MKLLVFLTFGVLSVLAEESIALKEFAAISVGYTANLYRELAKSNSGNFVVSPLSIQTVFALVNEGARENTAAQISSTLYLPQNKAKLRCFFRKLSRELHNNDQYTLASANRIYLSNYFKINEQFKTNAVDIFDSEIQNIDFADTQQAVSTINRWVEENTHDKIKNLVDDKVVKGDTIAVLINALYFQGTWIKEFADILPSYFFNNGKNAIITDTMFIADNFNYYKSPELNAKFLELPYQGNDITMTFVLPNDKEGLAALENRIADVVFAPKYQSEFVNVQIPRFKIETTTNLIPILQTLGITDAFSNHANFSGIGENKESFRISAVIQKAFIEVDEKGTTAAAATSISGDRISGGPQEPNFVADHPFLFYLHHKMFGILFIGRFSVAERTI